MPRSKSLLDCAELRTPQRDQTITNDRTRPVLALGASMVFVVRMKRQARRSIAAEFQRLPIPPGQRISIFSTAVSPNPKYTRLPDSYCMGCPRVLIASSASIGKTTNGYQLSDLRKQEDAAEENGAGQILVGYFMAGIRSWQASPCQESRWNRSRGRISKRWSCEWEPLLRWKIFRKRVSRHIS